MSPLGVTLCSMFDPSVRGDNRTADLYCARSFALERYVGGWYGVGHTARRQTGDTPGTAAGIMAEMYGSYILERYDLIKQQGRLVSRRREEASTDAPGIEQPEA